jgi:hypothetical protein
MRRLSSDERVREVIGRSWWESFPGSEPDRVQSTSVPGSWSNVKRPVLGRLGWNSYGTEGRNLWQRFGSPRAGKWLTEC